MGMGHLQSGSSMGSSGGSNCCRCSSPGQDHCSSAPCTNAGLASSVKQASIFTCSNRLYVASVYLILIKLDISLCYDYGIVIVAPCGYRPCSML